jgi:NitT/TauT family transport system substrate-binding protein
MTREKGGSAMRIGFRGLKRKVLIGIAFAGVMLLPALMVSTSQVSAEPLRVGVTPNVNCALVLLADSQGLFKKHGVEVLITAYETGPQVVNALTAGEVDIGGVAEVMIVFQGFRHPELRIPATISMINTHDLVVRKDRGILKPQDLKGKRVAVTRGSSSEFFFYNYLIFNRIPAGSIHVVYLDPTEMVKAMAAGTIDAALSWPPIPAEMEKQLGAKGARWPAQSGQNAYIVLTAKDSFLKKNPKAMERFLAALIEAAEFTVRYPDQAQVILSARLRVSADSLREPWSRVRFDVRLTQDLIVLMERETKWAMGRGLLEKKEMPNYLDFFYFDALDKLSPEAVSVVH